MMAILGTATLEEFLDLFRVLWFVRLLVYFLLLAGVIRLRKLGWISGGRLLVAGFVFLIVAESMMVAMERSWIEIGYSPSYAAMVREYEYEFELELPDWNWWEPVYWWTRHMLQWLGLGLAAGGLFLSGRGMARTAWHGTSTAEASAP